jgi:hypothetical protein
MLNFELALAIALSRTRQEELLMHRSIRRKAVGARAPIAVPQRLNQPGLWNSLAITSVAGGRSGS